MVERQTRPAVNKDGTLRRKPGPVAAPDDARTDRLALRVHPDLGDILHLRARELGISRSQYVEKLLIGWIRLDPRNRRLDLSGKLDPKAPTPEAVRRDPLSFAKEWQRFSTANMLLLRAQPPSEWFDEFEADPDHDEEPPAPRFR